MLREKLAALQHTFWANWMEYLFNKSIDNQDGTFTVPADQVTRWKRQMQTAYEELPEEEKASDRELADQMLGEIAKVKRADTH